MTVNPANSPLEAVHLTPVDPADPPAPARVSPEEAAELKARSAGIIAELEQTTGSKELQLLDSIGAVGLEAQRRASAELSFFRTRVGNMLSEQGAGGKVANDLVDLRVALDRINPAAGQGGVTGVIRRLPFGGSALNHLKRIAIRYETVSRQVVAIEGRLQEGRGLLRRDNLELRKLYEDVETQQGPIESNIYLGELLIADLERLLEQIEEPVRHDRIQTVLFDVAMRVQDLRTMQEVNLQFFVSIEMTRVNNSRLGQAVDRTLSLATNTLMVGLAIQVALARQKRVLEATQRTRQFLGDLVAANAAAVKQHSTDIGDVYKNPVIALDKLTQAHRDLVEAVALASRMEREGIASARANIQKLRQLTDELSQKSGALAAAAGPDREGEA